MSEPIQQVSVQRNIESSVFINQRLVLKLLANQKQDLLFFINSFTDQAGENEGDEINPESCRYKDDKRNGKS